MARTKKDNLQIKFLKRRKVKPAEVIRGPLPEPATPVWPRKKRTPTETIRGKPLPEPVFPRKRPTPTETIGGPMKTRPRPLLRWLRRRKKGIPPYITNKN